MMVLGGPTANLLTGLLGILFFGRLSTFTWWLVFFSLWMGIGNLIPFRRRTFRSDGNRILMLLWNRQLGERWLAIIQLGADLRNGAAPEDLRSDLLMLATAVQDDSPDTIVAYALAYAKADFLRQDDEAARLLEVCLQHLDIANQMLREVFFSDAGVFQARRRSRVDLAGQWLNDIPLKPQYPGVRLRIEAAILESQGDYRGAVAKLAEAILDHRSHMQKDMALRFLRRWQAELSSKVGPHPSAQSADPIEARL